MFEHQHQTIAKVNQNISAPPSNETDPPRAILVLIHDGTHEIAFLNPEAGGYQVPMTTLKGQQVPTYKLIDLKTCEVAKVQPDGKYSPSSSKFLRWEHGKVLVYDRDTGEVQVVNPFEREWPVPPPESKPESFEVPLPPRSEVARILLAKLTTTAAGSDLPPPRKPTCLADVFRRENMALPRPYV